MKSLAPVPVHSFCFVLAVPRVSSQLPAPATIPAVVAVPLLSHNGLFLPSGTRRPSNFFPLQAALAMVFSHSN